MRFLGRLFRAGVSQIQTDCGAPTAICAEIRPVILWKIRKFAGLRRRDDRSATSAARFHHPLTCRFGQENTPFVAALEKIARDLENFSRF